MSEIEERKKKWHIIYSPLALAVFFLAFILMTRAVWSVYNHELVSGKEKDKFQNELQTSDQRLAVLKKQVAYLETPQGVDKEIRSKFNVSKAGEGVAIIVGSVDSTNSATSSDIASKKWWQKALEFFGM